MLIWANVSLGKRLMGKCLMSKCLLAKVFGQMLYGQISYHGGSLRGHKIARQNRIGICMQIAHETARVNSPLNPFCQNPSNI
jgi:hypothetical protein